MNDKTNTHGVEKLILIPTDQPENVKNDGSASTGQHARVCSLSARFDAGDGVDYSGLMEDLNSSIQDSCYTVGLMYASARALEAFGGKSDCPATECGLNMSSAENGGDADENNGICAAGHLLPMIREAEESGRSDNVVALHYLLLEKLAKLRPEARVILDEVNARIEEQLADPGTRALAVMTYLQSARECGRADEEEVLWAMPPELKEKEDL